MIKKENIKKLLNILKFDELDNGTYFKGYGEIDSIIVDFNNGTLAVQKRVSSRITFTLKSKYDNRMNHTYLFDGYYANNSAIYKVYLIFALSGALVSKNLTQKAIKIEEYATF